MRTLRIGVTGLSRAGKTTFLTSLIHHLVDVPADQIPEWQGRLIHDAIPINDGLYTDRKSVFHFGKHLADLRCQPPQWPVSTREESRYRIELRLRTKGRRRQEVTRRIRLEFYDYPGEMLHDVPLVDQSYEAWSEQTLLRIATEVERKRGEVPESVRTAFDAWQAALGLYSSASPGDSGISETEPLAKAYRQLCLTLKESELPFFAPVHPVLALDKSSWLFCPLPAALRERNRSATVRLRKSYQDYVKNIVRPLRKCLTGCHKHVVLIDLVDILVHREPRHRRVQADLKAVLQGFYKMGLRLPAKIRDWLPAILRDRLPRWVQERRRPNVIFCATKADQARSDTRGNLRKLLKALVQKSADGLEIKGFHPDYLFCSAVRSTRDGSMEENGQGSKALKGTPKSSPDGTEATWWTAKDISDIPAEWPRYSEDWEEFQFVDFAPIRVPEIDMVSIPNICLIDVLNNLLEDYL